MWLRFLQRLFNPLGRKLKPVSFLFIEAKPFGFKNEMDVIKLKRQVKS